MARKRKAGDTAYNARRREYRAAQRYLKKAHESTGATAERNRALARSHFENALQTYDPNQKQPFSSQIVNLAAEFGVDIQGQRTEFITADEKKRKRAIERSYEALESQLKDDKKRAEREAQTLINNPAIGKRIMGGLVDVWRDKVKPGQSAAENRKGIQDAIFSFFGVDSWAGVLDKLFQAIGDLLFSTGNELETYDVVRIQIQKGIIGNTLVA